MYILCYSLTKQHLFYLTWWNDIKVCSFCLEVELFLFQMQFACFSFVFFLFTTIILIELSLSYFYLFFRTHATHHSINVMSILDSILLIDCLLTRSLACFFLTLCSLFSLFTHLSHSNLTLMMLAWGRRFVHESIIAYVQCTIDNRIDTTHKETIFAQNQSNLSTQLSALCTSISRVKRKENSIRTIWY